MILTSLDIIASLALVCGIIAGTAAFFLTAAYFMLTAKWPWQ